MKFEVTDIITREYEDNIVYVVENEEAKAYKIINLGFMKIGIFIDKEDNILGINILSNKNIYSPNKLIEYLEEYSFDEIKSNNNEIVKWWNSKIGEYQENKERNPYEDIEVTTDQLEEYFIKTVTEGHTLHDKDAKWTSYYINPPCGLNVKINNTTISYSSQKIKEIMIYSDLFINTIFFYDKNDHWLEDIDISTKESLTNVSFLFDYGDLKNSSTKNYEQQAFVELYEELNPYNDVEENRSILKEWLNENKEILDYK